MRDSRTTSTQGTSILHSFLAFHPDPDIHSETIAAEVTSYPFLLPLLIIIIICVTTLLTVFFNGFEIYLYLKA